MANAKVLKFTEKKLLFVRVSPSIYNLDGEVGLIANPSPNTKVGDNLEVPDNYKRVPFKIKGVPVVHKETKEPLHTFVFE